MANLTPLQEAMNKAHSEDRLPIELVDKLDELFPKGKCKERGQAMVFLAFAVMHYKSQKAQWDRESRIDERRTFKELWNNLGLSFGASAGSATGVTVRNSFGEEWNFQLDRDAVNALHKHLNSNLTSLNKGEQ